MQFAAERREFFQVLCQCPQHTLAAHYARSSWPAWMPRLAFAPARQRGARRRAGGRLLARGGRRAQHGGAPRGAHLLHQPADVGHPPARRPQSARYQPGGQTWRASSGCIRPWPRCCRPGKQGIWPWCMPAAPPTIRAAISRPWSSWSAGWPTWGVRPPAGSIAIWPAWTPETLLRCGPSASGRRRRAACAGSSRSRRCAPLPNSIWEASRRSPAC